MKSSCVVPVLVAVALLLLPNGALAACEANANDPCTAPKQVGSWEKSLSFGFNLTNGNSDTLLATVGGTVRRETAESVIDGALAIGYGEDETNKTDKQESVTRNDVRASAGYKNLISDRLFAGLSSSVLYDDIADVDYRVLVNPAAGYYLLKDADFKLMLEAGPSYTFEKVGGVKDDYLSPRISDRFEWIISCTSKLFQNAEAFIDIDDSENYIVNADLGIEAAISTSLALVLTVRNSYDNQPAAGRERNDVQVISSLKVAL